MKKIFMITILTIVGVVTTGYFAVVKNNTTFEGEKLVDITLKIDAPFSTATISIQENGVVVYSAKNGEQKEIRDSGAIAKAQVHELAKLIEEINFLDMRNRGKSTLDPLDGSIYTISTKILPRRAAKLASPRIHSVSCYQFSCEHNFLKLKDKIIELWGKDVIEAGV